jgi:hypothetical protein
MGKLNFVSNAFNKKIKPEKIEMTVFECISKCEKIERTLNKANSDIALWKKTAIALREKFKKNGSLSGAEFCELSECEASINAVMKALEETKLQEKLNEARRLTF